MRKAFSSAFEIPRGIILPLLFLLILIAIAAGPVKGQIADSDAYMRSAMPDWLWGCKTNLGDVDYEGFMNAMKGVYDSCEDPAKKICGKESCTRVTVKLGGDSCRKVNKGVLDTHGIGPLLEQRLFCDVPCTVSDETPTCSSCSARLTIEKLENDLCRGAKPSNMCGGTPQSSWFIVKEGAQVDITAERVSAPFVPEFTSSKLRFRGGANVADPDTCT